MKLQTPQSWATFETRLKRARQTIFGIEGGTILVVSSGGAISKIVPNALGVSQNVDLQPNQKCLYVDIYLLPSHGWIFSECVQRNPICFCENAASVNLQLGCVIMDHELVNPIKLEPWLDEHVQGFETAEIVKLAGANPIQHFD